MIGQDPGPRPAVIGSNVYFALAAVLGVVALVGVVLLMIRPGAGEPRARNIPSTPPGRTLHFAPIGDFPASDAEALVAHYRDRLGIEVDLLPTLSIPAEAIDPARNQVIAEQLTMAIRQHPVAADPGGVIIGLTNADMYIASKSWLYAYSLRVADKYAVVSSARMNAFGADQAQQMERLQKMVTKQVGILYYGLSPSSDPTSVLYDNINGPLDLDRVSEEY
jgi:predicted Zn-dependent protease